MKEIKLTKGRVAIVDDEDFETIKMFKWYAHESKPGIFYARRDKYIGIINGKQKSKKILMHRSLLSIDSRKTQVDHKNSDTLDNRKENLRICTNKENSTNKSKLRSDNTSGYRGIYENNRLSTRKYFAFIRDKDNKRITIGRFSTIEKAAKAFDKAAKVYYGEFCGKLNFE